MCPIRQYCAPVCRPVREFCPTNCFVPSSYVHPPCIDNVYHDDLRATTIEDNPCLCPKHTPCCQSSCIDQDCSPFQFIFSPHSERCGTQRANELLRCQKELKRQEKAEFESIQRANNRQDKNRRGSSLGSAIVVYDSKGNVISTNRDKSGRNGNARNEKRKYGKTGKRSLSSPDGYNYDSDQIEGIGGKSGKGGTNRRGKNSKGGKNGGGGKGQVGGKSNKKINGDYDDEDDYDSYSGKGGKGGKGGKNNKGGKNGKHGKGGKTGSDMCNELLQKCQNSTTNAKLEIIPNFSIDKDGNYLLHFNVSNECIPDLTFDIKYPMAALNNCGVKAEIQYRITNEFENCPPHTITRSVK